MALGRGVAFRAGVSDCSWIAGVCLCVFSRACSWVVELGSEAAFSGVRGISL